MPESPLAPAPALTAADASPRGLSIRHGALPVLIAATLWGTTGTASTFAPAGTAPVAIGAAGLTVGGLLLFVTSRRVPSPRFSRAERWLIALGAVAVPGWPLAFYPAVARAGVAIATVIALGSAPVFAGLLAWLTGQGRPTARWAVATLAAAAGCTLLVTGPLVAGPVFAGPVFAGHSAHVRLPLAGIALAALAGLSYAAYSLISGRLIARGHESSRVMGAMFGGGALLALPVLLISGTHWLATVRGAAVALHLAVFTTFVAYRLFGAGLRSTPAPVATTLTLAEPAVATVLGVALLGERLPAVSWAGMAALAAGLAVLALPARPRVPSSSPRRRSAATPRAGRGDSPDGAGG